MQNAVVLWTGGKDSCLSLHLARDNGLTIIALVTFVPIGNTEFRAHPQFEMREQAKKLSFDLHFVEVTEPYRQSYIEGLKWIQETLDAAVVITGDIDEVGGMPNWIEDCCKELSGLTVFRPLWKKPRDWIMNEIIARGIQARISWLNHPALPKEWLGRIINEDFLKEMKTVSVAAGTDLTGENGEYHTMTG